MRHGVDHRLRRRVEQSVGLRARPRVTHRHHVDRLAMRVFDLRGDLLKPRLDRTVARGALLVQPAAQFALLRTGEREHLLRLGRMQLDQRERLQHAIVQMRRHVGALLFAFLERALAARSAHQGDELRHERAQYACEQCEPGAQAVEERHGAVFDRGLRDEQRVGGEDKQHADDCGDGLPRARIEAQPGQAHAGRGEQHRQQQAVARLQLVDEQGDCDQHDARAREQRGFEASSITWRMLSMLTGRPSASSFRPV